MVNTRGERLHFALGCLRQFLQTKAGPVEEPHESPGEYRVWIGVALRELIECGLSEARRIEQENTLCRLHLHEPTVTANTAVARGLERVIPTCIQHQHDDPGPTLLQRIQDCISTYGLARDETFLAFARRRRIGRQQVIGVLDRNAVASEEEERGISTTDPSRHLGKLLIHRPPI